MRRLADLMSQHVQDLGGTDNISQSEHVLIRRCAVLTLQLEMMEKRWADANEGEASADQINTYQRVANSLHRILAGLGLQRRSRDITTLGDVLRADLRRQQEKAS